VRTHRYVSPEYDATWNRIFRRFFGPDQVVSPMAGIEGTRANVRGRYEFYVLETNSLRTYKRQKRFCFPCLLTSNGLESTVATVEDLKADH
jgi:hypothetical protein